MTRILLAVAFAIPLWQAPAAAAAPDTVHVAMSGFAFGPSTVNVTVGDTVVWANHDEAPHDAVTTDAPASFRSPLLESGQTWRFTFTVAGTYRYYCSVHPSMRATIVVKPKPRPAAPSPSPSPSVAQAPITTTTATTPAASVALPVSTPPPSDRRPLVLTIGVTVAASLFSLLLLSSTR